MGDLGVARTKEEKAISGKDGVRKERRRGGDCKGGNDKKIQEEMRDRRPWEGRRGRRGERKKRRR